MSDVEQVVLTTDQFEHVQAMQDAFGDECEFYEWILSYMTIEQRERLLNDAKHEFETGDVYDDD